MGQKTTRRPRNLDAPHASGILYGSLGTSKIYVIGLAFAIAGYASFWLILAVSILTLLIGLNYIVVCKYFPNGGGVYASVRKYSEVVSLLGALFLLADYIITASLSALSAFHYLGVPHPTFYAIASIIALGVLNYWGPRRLGKYAFAVALASVSILVILFFFSIPHIAEGFRLIKPLSGKVSQDWVAFVGVILTLSGIEAAASMTGVMRLDPGATPQEPKVMRTARKAIWFSILETAFFTTFFTLMLCSVRGLELSKGNVIAQSGENIRDSAFRFLGSSFVGDVLGSTAGFIFGICLAVVFAALLLSAVNTAINSMVSLFYIMAQDKEFPSRFKRVNRFGVPWVPLIVATILPFAVLLVVDNIAVLASLYAVGFVGAITLNLSTVSLDFKLPVKVRERLLLGISALIMLSIEITLFVTKVHAVVYLLSILVVGLVLRGLAKEAKQRKKEAFVLDKEIHVTPFPELKERGGALCIVKGRGQALKLAKEWAAEKKEPLCFLFVCEQRVMADVDFERMAEGDHNAVKLFNFLHKELKEEEVAFAYVVTDAPAFTISNTARWMQAKAIFMDVPKKGIVAQLLRGDAVREIWKMLPEEIELFVLPTL